jgi:hypothetical protein
MSRCFKAVGIRGSSVTHLPRSAGAKSLEQKGVSEDQIRRLGELTPMVLIHYQKNSQGLAIINYREVED